MNAPEPAPLEQARIADHGVIGDLRTIALVACSGTIDFLCWPRFDSPSVFARLLDAERGGFFQLAAEQDGGQKQLYLPETNVLLTHSLSASHIAEVLDWMDLADEAQRLVRVARAVRGDVRFDLRCAPRFDYGRAEHRVELEDERTAVFRAPRWQTLRLRSTVPLEIDGSDVVARFALRRGEEATFILESEGAPALPGSVSDFGARSLTDAVTFWRAWMKRSTYRGRWREIVGRSALLLKLHQSREHGAIIAAPTFGLPEAPGGVRNWDYRYTWIRDAGFTLFALARLGYTEEANAFMGWVDARVAEEALGGAPLHVMYRIDGRRDLDEQTLEHLDGHGGARPVRIGNGAFDQVQLDIYGALLDAVYLANKYGDPSSHASWQNIRRIVDWVVDHWNEPDEGIWEFRGGRRHFLHSRLMCWVAVDRAIRLAQKRSFAAPFGRWVEARNAIHDDIHASFWNAELGAFVQYAGGSALDAACLLMPLLRFISPVDPRWLSTLDAIGSRLADDAFVRRYDAGESADVDALPGTEGTFTACSFWYVECLARAGRVDEARVLFEKILSFANHVGLFSEELGPAAEHLGNFPQALTHLSLISAAYTLDRELSPVPRGAWER